MLNKQLPLVRKKPTKQYEPRIASKPHHYNESPGVKQLHTYLDHQAIKHYKQEIFRTKQLFGWNSKRHSDAQLALQRF